jgi:hypothetical protein
VGNTRAQGIAHNNLGNIHAQLKEFGEAENHLSQAVEDALQKVNGDKSSSSDPLGSNDTRSPTPAATTPTPSSPDGFAEGGMLSIGSPEDSLALNVSEAIDPEERFNYEMSLCNRRANLIRVRSPPPSCAPPATPFRHPHTLLALSFFRR